MLPSSGYFKNIPCPFLSTNFGFCERPHCHYKHEKKGPTAGPSLQSYSTALSSNDLSGDGFLGLPQTEPDFESKTDLLQYYSNAIRKLQDELNKQNEIIQSVPTTSEATYIPTPVAKTKPIKQAEKKSADAIPQYNPTPISTLNKFKKYSTTTETEEYDPTDVFPVNSKRKRVVEEYDPTKVQPKNLKTNKVPSSDLLLSDDEMDDHVIGGEPAFSDDDFCDPPVINPPKDKVIEIKEKPTSPKPNVLNEFDVVNKILTESKLKDEQALLSEASGKVAKPEIKSTNALIMTKNGKRNVFRKNSQPKNVDQRSSVNITSHASTSKSASNKTENVSDKENSKTVNFKISQQAKTETKSNLDSQKIDSMCDSSVENSTTGTNTLLNSNDKTNKLFDALIEPTVTNPSKSSSADHQTLESGSSKSSSSSKVTKSSSSKHSKHSSSSSKDKKKPSDSRHVSSSDKHRHSKTDSKSKSSSSSKSGEHSKSSEKHKSSKHSSKDPSKSKSSSKETKSRDSKSKSSDKGSSKHKKSSSSKHSESTSDSKKEGNKSPKKTVPKITIKISTLDSNEIDSLLSDLDSDLDEHDTEEECWRIFNEEQIPAPAVVDPSPKKVKPPEVTEEPSQPVEFGKKRVAHQPDVHKPSNPLPPKIMAPAMALQMRYQKLQEMYLKTREAQLLKNESHTPPSFVSNAAKPGERKRISHVPNAALIAAAASRKYLQNGNSNAPAIIKPEITQTIAVTNPKGTKRVAHVPSAALSTRPVLPLTAGNKVPLVIRQKFIKFYIDECLKFCATEDEAFTRGLQEEDNTYKRSMNRKVYQNVGANTIKKLREEGVNSVTPVPKPQPILTQKKPVSHEAMLGGARAAKTSFSIEKNRSKTSKENALKGPMLYSLLKPYLMTQDKLDENGYPSPHPTCPGKAVFKVLDNSKKGNLQNPYQKTCCRCQALYYVNKNGIYLKMDDCVYHWGRLWKRKISGSWESRYSCCQGDSESDGCCVGMGHVHDEYDPEKITGFIQTFSKSVSPEKGHGVYALDCEMCYTTQGIELSRITVIDEDLNSCYEALVRPENPVLDHNTRFSGITEDHLIGVTTTLRDVQAVLLSMFSDKTILIGHSLESDLKALKLIHNTVVDTAIVFPHKNGPPYKRALRTLMAENLRKIIQNEVDGHDSQEDAMACMELMLWKLKEDLKNCR